ncbi:thiamine pyrophosphate-requiring protein [Nocardiopsis kunsanensis]|uniref:Thiamine pyrophosphate-requiring protein n=1 Tax=Nocardiopsis kunsanensis TaxID=141693 RepID=A0A918XB77_9ACTN|nr:thiamine pyrophosphate-requiring protein [Nocardiopsis kunsanensis]GHD24227.1 thiamine pyrophosphate-requiring protein [Nocardiopsis kunsanensis]
MSQSVANHLLRRLSDWGVTEIYGYPGDSVNGLVAELGRMEGGPRFVQSRHEEMAAFEAVGRAKFDDGVGVCMATGGPGAVHLLNGLYDAKLDHVPVVAVLGQATRSAVGGSYMQEIDLHSLYKDVAGAYIATVSVPEQLPNVLDRAVRTALAERAPTAVIVPADVQEADYSPPTHDFLNVPSSKPSAGPVAPSKVLPPESEIDRAAAVVDRGDKIAVLIGQGARGAEGEVQAFADATGAGVAKALLGKDVLDDTLPYVTGSIGLLGTRPSWELMRDCDTLVIVGSNMPYTQFLPPFGRKAVQIDLAPGRIGLRYPTEVNLVGDAATTLRALTDRLTRDGGSGGRPHWRSTVETNVERWHKVQEAQAEVAAEPINPMKVFRELSPLLPHNAIVTADSGSATNWYARFLQFRPGMRGSLSGTLATMGCAVPYAIGAKFAHPDRPVIALVGDGAMQMNGLMELLTAQRYSELWEDPRFVVCVLHNNDLNQVTWELRSMAGSPKTTFSQDLPDLSYAGFAESVGMKAITVDEPDKIVPAWHSALSDEGPVVLDVHCDGDVPPIPPQVEFDQAVDTAKSLLSGDPDTRGVAARGIATKLQEYLPQRG